jgi:hypothetical protein
MFTLQQACGSYRNITKKQYSSSGMSFYFPFGALQTLPLALSPLNNQSIIAELKCQLLFRTVEFANSKFPQMLSRAMCTEASHM